VITTVMCGFDATAGARNVDIGTNGSSAAVMTSAGTRMRSMTRIALARW